MNFDVSFVLFDDIIFYYSNYKYNANFNKIKHVLMFFMNKYLKKRLIYFSLINKKKIKI